MKRLILATVVLAAASTAYAATAFFTGKQHQVQTVTGKVVWECEYRYLNRTFTRLFETSCPGSVEVE